MKHACLLPLALFLGACGMSAEDKFDQAQAAYAEHQYRLAKLNLADALADRPNDPQLLVLQARTLVALGDGVGAGAALDRLPAERASSAELRELAAEAAILRNAPQLALDKLGDLGSAGAHRLRALAAIQTGDIAGAEGHFAKAVQAGGDVRAFTDFARYKLMSGDAAGALAMAAKAKQLDPAALDTLLVTGQLAARQGDLKAALETYDRAARLYPHSLAALIGKAAVLGDLGRLEEMKPLVRELAARAPNDRSVLYLRSREATARKDWAAVRTAVDGYRGPPLAQRDPIRLLHGEALSQLGQHEQAIAQIGPIARSETAGWSARTLLARAQLGAGDAAAAVATMRPVVDFTAASPEALALLVEAARRANDPALPRYEARLRSPAAKALAAAIAEADAAMRTSNWAAAADGYQRVLALAEGDAMVLNNMAYAQVMLGNYAKANDFAARALKAAPDNPSVLDTAGWAQVKSGRDIESGKRLLRQAAKKAPNNPVIRAHLAEAERIGR